MTTTLHSSARNTSARAKTTSRGANSGSIRHRAAPEMGRYVTLPATQQRATTGFEGTYVSAGLTPPAPTVRGNYVTLPDGVEVHGARPGSYIS